MNFTQEFTRGIKAVFLKDYVLNKERLLSVLPHQMKSFCADELNQKYNDYFPTSSDKPLPCTEGISTTYLQQFLFYPVSLSSQIFFETIQPFFIKSKLYKIASSPFE